MGIQPIDLQTMYQQLSNVSKTLSGAQQAQLTEAMQQQNNIQKNLEMASRVQNTSNEKSTANNVNQNGSNAGTFAGRHQQNKKDDNEKQDEYNNNPIRSDSAYLGTIIDITR